MQLDPEHQGKRRAVDDFTLSMLGDTPKETVDVVERSAVDTVRSGSSFELVMSGIAVILTIVGLTGYMPIAMASFAMMAVGFALLANGISMSVWRQRSMRAQYHDRAETVGVGTEVLGGFTAIVLGVFSLIGNDALVLLPVASIVLGVAVLLGGPAQSHLMWIVRPVRHDEATQSFVWASGGAMAMAGGAALGLGIFALVRGPTIGPSLVATLSIGVALVLAGGALVGRLARRFTRVPA